MKTIEAKAGQSLLDIAMMHCGDAGEWHRVAVMNGKEDTWVAAGGEKLLLPEAESDGYVARLAREGVEPCTGEGEMEGCE